jgi:hypothetical protein
MRVNLFIPLALLTLFSPAAVADLSDTGRELADSANELAWGPTGTYCYTGTSCGFTCGAFEGLTISAHRDPEWRQDPWTGQYYVHHFYVSIEATCGGITVACGGWDSCGATSGRGYSFDGGFGVCRFRDGTTGDARASEVREYGFEP